MVMQNMSTHPSPSLESYVPYNSNPCTIFSTAAFAQYLQDVNFTLAKTKLYLHIPRLLLLLHSARHRGSPSRGRRGETRRLPRCPHPDATMVRGRSQRPQPRRHRRGSAGLRQYGPRHCRRHYRRGMYHLRAQRCGLRGRGRRGGAEVPEWRGRRRRGRG